MDADRRVVVLDTGYDAYDCERQLLADAGYRLELFEGGRHDRAGKLAFARGAAGMFLRWTELDGAALDAVPSVRAIVRYGVGYDNIDIPAATARGIAVCNVQGYATHSVSDHALALILSCLRSLREGTADLRVRFGAPPAAHAPELNALCLGIVGLGRIGGALAAKARHLFARVLACDPYVPAERFTAHGAERCDLSTLVRESDVVSIHCNLTEKTRGMFSREVLGQMRRDAVLINTARGPTVDEDALYDALAEGRLFAAGLDVFHDEPPGANRDSLLAHPRVVATGHYAWYSNQAARELQRRAAHNMAAMLAGTVPEDCLNPEGWEKGSGVGKRGQASFPGTARRVLRRKEA